MTPVHEKVRTCLQSVQRQIDFQPKVGIVLGSGLGDYVDEIDVAAVLPYGDIAGFPVSTVEGHAGRFVFGRVRGLPVVAMQGRVHYYEGYPMSDVVLPTRLMGEMGISALLLTNAAGSVNLEYRAGDFMLIRGHISSFVPSPLIGPNLKEDCPRFPDMSRVYDPDLRRCVRDAASGLGIPLREGVYIQFTGPNYETPEEIVMGRALGADAAGMSTACEAIAARHMGLRVCGISNITNLGCGISDTPLSHEEVFETAQRTAPLFRSLVTASLAGFAQELGEAQFE